MNTHATQQRTGPKPSAAAGGYHVLQRKCACGSSASGLTGECTECGKKKLRGLQTKLAISEPDDVYEREADRIAEQVLAMPSRPATRAAPLQVQRFAGRATGTNETTPASVDRALAASGQPLEPVLRQDMEQRFGHDFSRVRIHVDDDATAAIDAHAFTTGERIVFSSGHFPSATPAGRKLLAHELTHVVQQRAGGAAAAADGLHEGQADATAQRSGVGHAAGPSTCGSPMIQREAGLEPPENIDKVYNAWIIELSRKRENFPTRGSVAVAARERIKATVGPANFANWERWKKLDAEEEAREMKAEADAKAEAEAKANKPFNPQEEVWVRYTSMKNTVLALSAEVARVERAAAGINFGGGLKGGASRFAVGGYTALWGVGGRSVSTAVDKAPLLLLEGAGTALGSEFAERKLVEDGQSIRQEGEEIGEDVRTSVRVVSGEMQASYDATRPSYKKFMEAQSKFWTASSLFLKEGERGDTDGYLKQARFCGDMNSALKDMRDSADDYLMTCAKLGIENDAKSLRTLSDNIVKGAQQSVGTAVTSVVPDLAPGLDELAGALKGAKGAKPLEKELADATTVGTSKKATETAQAAVKKEATPGAQTAIKREATQDTAEASKGALRESEAATASSKASKPPNHVERPQGAGVGDATTQPKGSAKAPVAKTPPSSDATLLEQAAQQPGAFQRVADPKFSRDYIVEIRVGKHTYRKHGKRGTWCRFSTPECGFVLDPNIDQKAKDAVEAPLSQAGGGVPATADKPTAASGSQPSSRLQPALEPPVTGAPSRYSIPQLDDAGRPTQVDAIINKADLVVGQRPSNPSNLPAGTEKGLGYEITHLGAHELGFPTTPGNLTTASGQSNRFLGPRATRPPTMRRVELDVRKAIQAGETVHYRVTAIYDGASPYPSAFHMQASGSGGLQIDTVVRNWTHHP